MHVEFRYKKENAEGEKVMYSNDNYNEIYLAVSQQIIIPTYCNFTAN